jgi:hypothetical protein
LLMLWNLLLLLLLMKFRGFRLDVAKKKSVTLSLLVYVLSLHW